MSAETEYFAEVEAELKDLWMNDPPIIEDEDSVVSEDDLVSHAEVGRRLGLNTGRDGGAEISGGE